MMADVLSKWQSLEPQQRPVCLVQYDGACLGVSAAPKCSSVRLAFVVHFDEARYEVTVGECSVRHRASTWTLPVDTLWNACKHVGKLCRSGGIMTLALRPVNNERQRDEGS